MRFWSSDNCHGFYFWLQNSSLIHVKMNDCEKKNSMRQTNFFIPAKIAWTQMQFYSAYVSSQFFSSAEFRKLISKWNPHFKVSNTWWIIQIAHTNVYCRIFTSKFAQSLFQVCWFRFGGLIFNLPSIKLHYCKSGLTSFMDTP